ncbi:MAG: hypothetical protein IPK82_21615 [Polyangiaceae bacterium]|nr:hypothetical protein [Polyangiaceae bacterium]
MDPFEPIAGVSLEQYAEVSAHVAVARGNAVKVGEALGKAGVSSENWERANAAWSVRLADPMMGVRLAGSFEDRYHQKLTELLGSPPDVPPEDFAAMLGESMVAGLPAMGKLRGVDPLTWSRISYAARKAGMTEPKAFAACLALAAQIAERRLAGLVQPNATGASGGPTVDKTFEKDAAVAAKAVGRAFCQVWTPLVRQWMGSASQSWGRAWVPV